MYRNVSLTACLLTIFVLSVNHRSQASSEGEPIFIYLPFVTIPGVYSPVTLEIIPFDANQEDLGGPSSWSTNYGKTPEIIVASNGVALDVLVQDYNPETDWIAALLHIEPNTDGGYDITQALTDIPMLDRIMGLANDSAGNLYYATSVDESDVVNSEYPPLNTYRNNIVRIIKLSPSGDILFNIDLDTARYAYNSNAEMIINPMVASSSRLAVGGNEIALVHGINTDPDWNIGGVRHQKALSTRLDATNGDIIRTSSAWVSHSFDQRLVYDGEGIIEHHLGDAYPRYLVFDRNHQSYPLFRIKGPLGENNTHTRLGNVALIENDPTYEYIALFATENSAATGDRISGPRNLAIVRVNGNDNSIDPTLPDTLTVTSSGTPYTNRLRWLTNYSVSSNLHAERPKLVGIGSDQYIVLWEEWLYTGHFYDTFNGVYGMVIDDEGNILQDAKLITNDHHLHRGDDAFFLDGQAAWMTGNAVEQVLYLHLVDNMLNYEMTTLSSITHSALDFDIIDIEVFQSSQTDDNAVPLVANKDAVARVYARTATGTSPNDVVVTLSAWRNGALLGTLTSTPSTIPASPDRGDLSTTYNFALPHDWLSSQVDLVATVDANNAHTESNESNNQFSHTVSFTDIPILHVQLVPINYSHQGPTNPGFYPGESADYISDWIMRAYPISGSNIVLHSPYSFVGDLEDSSGKDWLNLLDEMYILKLSDGYPETTPIVYYAFVPIQNGSTQWFFGGIAGIGWISPPGEVWRESVGLNLGPMDDSGSLAGHEIGHNFGRYHAPCGGATGVDPSYPYPGASIGQYGMDIQLPFATLHSPSTHTDLMGYCEPQWLSDYTYTELYDNQRLYGTFQPGQAEQRLVIRAHVNEDESVLLKPTYAFEIQVNEQIAPRDYSDYIVELVDNKGGVVAVHAMNRREAVEEGLHAFAILGTVPMPEESVAQVRLLHMGQVVAERLLSEDVKETGTVVSVDKTAEHVTLQWDLAEVPAIIRYTLDDGQSWMTVGVDVIGGEWTVDTTSLPSGVEVRFEIILSDTMSPTILTADLVTP